MTSRDQTTDKAGASVHILGTGGTIANVTGQYTSKENFLTLDELLERAPDTVKSNVSISYTEITHEASHRLTPSVWFQLAEEIETLSNGEDPPNGFVITHGSNTVEETAYFLNLVLETNRPVVLTAAQRNVKKLGSDGYKNLASAIQVAATPESHGRGVMIVVNEEIHHARDVTKSVSGRVDAWCSPNSGRIGDTTPEVQFHAGVDRPSTGDVEFGLPAGGPEAYPLTDVHIVYSCFADNGTLVRNSMDEARGYVVAAFPSICTASPNGLDQQRVALQDAAERGIPVVLCNRGLEGYKPAADPFIVGGTLRPQKARILLALGLGQTTDFDELQRLFDTY